MSEQNSSGGQEQATSASSEVSYVPIPEATDDQLKDFIENFNPDSEEEALEDVAEEQNINDEPLRDAEQEGSESKVNREQELEAKLAEANKRLAQQEQYIQHRRNEIGELRKERKELRAKLSEGLDDVIDPIEAAKRVRAIEKIDDQLESLDYEQKNNDYVFAQQKIVAKHVKPDEFNMDNIVSLLEADGADPQAIKKFQQDPYSVAPGELIVQLVKRANSEARERMIIAWARKMYEEKRKMYEENQSLKGKPDRLLDKINQAAKMERPLNSAGGNAKSSVRKSNLTNVPVGELSDEELAELVRSAE